MIKNVSEALEVTDCRVADIPRYFWYRDRCSVPGSPGGRSVQERGREGGKKGDQRRKEAGAKAPVHWWPVASRHHPLPRPVSRAHLRQAESLVPKGTTNSSWEAEDKTNNSDGASTGQTFNTVGNLVDSTSAPFWATRNRWRTLNKLRMTARTT